MNLAYDLSALAKCVIRVARTAVQNFSCTRTAHVKSKIEGVQRRGSHIEILLWSANERTIYCNSENIIRDDDDSFYH